VIKESDLAQGQEEGRKRRRDPVPIVVAVYHREEDTRAMFKQLAKVTDNYSLIIVNNGFDDARFLRKLKPAHYIENEANTGAIRPINQGLEVAEGEYIAVLHNDLLIFDEGWLDHIIDFMERKPEVGLVGLAGRHSINADGSLDLETTVVKMRGYPLSYKPTWRFTEVATIDGLGWVMRNRGFRLEEGFGLMHFYDLDLSLQYVDAGYRIYSAAVDIQHLAEFKDRSTRTKDEYLKRVGGDDEAYYEEVREMFRAKWEHLLPITRGFQDEAYAFNRIQDLEEFNKGLIKDNEAKEFEIIKASKHIFKVEKLIGDMQAEMQRMQRHIEKLEKRLADESAKHMRHHWRQRVAQKARANPITADSGPFTKLVFYVRTEGLMTTSKRATSFARRKLGRG
jgi:glycosyltransferase involved in cell wall biosynthesis